MNQPKNGQTSSQPAMSDGKLSFFIAEQKSILIVSFIGPFTYENLNILEECCHKLEGAQARWVIFNFRDVPQGMDRRLNKTIVQMQKLARQKPADVRISSIHPQLKVQLLEQGLIRAEEITNNLADALQSLPLAKVAA